MIREFILKMKLRHLEVQPFRDKFGVDVLERFAGPLAELQEEGLLGVENGEILLERDGLLCVDNLLHEFFLPQHRTDRIV